MKNFFISGIVFFISILFAYNADARPWCSSKNLNTTERTICNNSELRDLDAQLEKVYGRAKAYRQDYGQLNWLKNHRNACGSDVYCIADEYRSRIALLVERIGYNDAPNARPWCSARNLNITEKTICKTSFLRDIDAELQVTYGLAQAKNQANGQIFWLRKQRDACGSDTSCIENEYNSRISLLKSRLGKQDYVETYTTENSSTDNTSSDNTSYYSCSETRLNELKAVCVISAVGEKACSSVLERKLPKGAFSSISAGSICSIASGYLLDGSIEPESLGLSIASGFLDGAGDSLFESQDSFDKFFGVVFKLGSVSMTLLSIDKCMKNAERICQ